jgi:hypothetical protein
MPPPIGKNAFWKMDGNGNFLEARNLSSADSSWEILMGYFSQKSDLPVSRKQSSS